MAELKLGTAFVDVIPKVNAAGAAAAQAQTGGLLSGLASSAASTGLAIGAAVTAGVAVAGLALFKLGGDVNEAYRTIRIGTGATGEALEGLEASFRKVGGSVAGSFGDSAKAIADLNTRTGLTGKALEDLSVTELRLAKLTKQDLGEQIRSTTRLFGDWGVAVEDQTTTLDYLFKVSQATGIGVTELSDKLVRFGAPLRQLGFSFEESAALMGKFEKEGVNADLVLGSLRIALGKMARAGEPAQETLRRTVDEIKNAGSTSEANALALELFGARAGPDMAAAIREGRFEIGSLVDSLSSSTETIAGAVKETSTLSGKFGVLRNKVSLAIAPLASGFYNAVNGLAGVVLPKLADGIGFVAGKIEVLVGWIGQAKDAVVAGFNGAEGTGILGFFMKVGDVARTVWDFIQGTAIPAILEFGGNAWNGLLETIDTVKLAIGGFFAAFTEGDVTSDGFVGLLERAGVAARELVELIRGGLLNAWESLKAGFNGEEGPSKLFTDLGNAARTVVDYFNGTVIPFFETEVRPKIEAAFGWIQTTAADLREKLEPVVRSVFGWLADHLPIVAGALGLIIAPIPTLIAGFVVLYERSELVRDVIERIVGALQPFIAALVELGGQIVGNMIDRLRAVWEILDAIVHLDLGGVIDGFRDFFGSFVDDAKAILGTLGPALLDLFRNLGITDLLGKAFTEGLPKLGGMILEGLGNLLENVPSWILNVLDGLLIAVGTVFGDWLPRAIAAAGPFIRDGLSAAFDFLADLPNIIGGLVQQYGPTVGKVIIGAILLGLKAVLFDIPKWIITEMIPAVIDALITHGPDVLATIADLIGKIPGVLLTISGEVGKTFLTILGGLLEVASSWFGALPRLLFNLLKKAFDALVEYGPDVLEAVAGWLLTVPGWIVEQLASLGGLLVSAISAAFGWIVSNGPTILAGLLSWFTSLPGKAIEALGSLGELIGGWISAAWDWITTNGPTILAAYLEWWKELPGKILEVIGNLGEFMVENVYGPAFEWIVNELPGKALDLLEWFAGLPGMIVEKLGDLGGWLWTHVFEPGAVWIYEHTVGKFDELLEFFRGLPGKLAEAAGDLFGFLVERIKSAMNAVIDVWNNFEIPSFTIGGWTLPDFLGGGTLPSWDTPAVPFPDIPKLEDGGTALRSGLSIVGEAGVPELVNLPRGASVVPLDVAALIAEAARSSDGSGDVFNFPTQDGPTAAELFDYVELMTGRKLTSRNDQ